MKHDTIFIEFVFRKDQKIIVYKHEFIEGTTLESALAYFQSIYNEKISNEAIGIWGRKRSKNILLKAYDRIELYDAFVLDPKKRRRNKKTVD